MYYGSQHLRSQSSVGFVRRYLDLPFLLTLLLVASLLGIVFGIFSSKSSLENIPWIIPELYPVLRVSADSISPFTLFTPFFRAALLWFSAIFLPLGFFSIVSRIVFSKLEYAVQRLIALLTGGIYAFLGFAVLAFSNHAWLENSIFENFLNSGSTFFMAVRSVFLGLCLLALLIAFISHGETSAGKNLRILFVIVIIGSWLYYDWQKSRTDRNLASENLKENNLHTFVLLIPDLSARELTEIIQLPSLVTLKDRLQGILPVLPSSDSNLAQSVSILTGLQPFQHGVRFDYMKASDVDPIAGHMKTLYETKFPTLHATTIGDVNPTNGLLKEFETGTKCAWDIKNLKTISTLEHMQLAASQLPEFFLRFLYPESDCSQKYFSLPHLVREEFHNVSQLLSKPTKLFSLWWLNPNPYTGLHFTKSDDEKVPNEPPWQSDWASWEKDFTAESRSFLSSGYVISENSNAKSRIRLEILQQTLTAFEEYINHLKLTQSAKIIIVGLGTTSAKYGALGVFSEEKIPSLKVLSDNKIVLSSAQVTNIIRNLPVEKNIPGYFESIKFPKALTDKKGLSFATDLTEQFKMDWKVSNHSLEGGSPSMPQPLLRAALFKSTRFSLCPFATPEGTVVLRSHTNSHFDLRNTLQHSVSAERIPLSLVLKDRVSCESYNRKVLEGSFATDISLPLEQRSVSLMQSNQSPTSAISSNSGTLIP